jgi:hypothetical protein
MTTTIAPSGRISEQASRAVAQLKGRAGGGVGRLDPAAGVPSTFLWLGTMRASWWRARGAHGRCAPRFPRTGAGPSLTPASPGALPRSGRSRLRSVPSRLKAEKATAEAALGDLPTAAPSGPDLGAALARLPDLSEALRDADAATKRQVFDAFDLRCVYDKLDGRVEISATITEAVADLLQAPALEDLGLWGRSLRGWDSPTTLTHEYALAA